MYNVNKLNDFEKNIFEIYPSLKEIKETIYESGAMYAAMSGSGSTLYGIFKKDSIINYPFKQTYFYRILNLDWF